MKAVTWHGKHDLRVSDVPEPDIVNPHDAIIRVTMTAICGTDLHLYNGFMPGMRAGDIIGHEFMGDVVAVGKACERVQIGDRVVVMCAIACGRCWFCRHQQHVGCDNTNPTTSQVALELVFGHAGAALFGFSHLYGGYAGGQAEYVRVPFADVGCLRSRRRSPTSRRSSSATSSRPASRPPRTATSSRATRSRCSARGRSVRWRSAARCCSAPTA